MRKLEHQSAQRKRIQLVAGIKRGKPVADVAVAFGVNEPVLYRLMSSLAEICQNVLKVKTVQWRPPKLKDKHLRCPASTLRNIRPAAAPL